MQRSIHAQLGGAIPAFRVLIGCSQMLQVGAETAGGRDTVEASTSLVRAAAARPR